MKFSELIIFSMATWRIASLLTQEDGPFFLFRRLREWTGIVHDNDGNVMSVPESFLGGLLSCVWCCSIWVAISWVLFFLFFADITLWVAFVFAISTGTVLIDRYLEAS